MPTSAEDEYTEGYNKQRKGRDDPDLIVTIGSSQIHLNSYLSLSELPSGFKLNYRIITDTSTRTSCFVAPPSNRKLTKEDSLCFSSKK
jgi:hypothetical protein